MADEQQVEKAVTLTLANPPAGSSAQPVDEDQWTPDDGLRPPLNLDHLAALSLSAPLRRSCIAAVVLNTVGLGVEVRVREGAADQVSEDDEPEQVLARLDALSRRDERSHSPNFAGLLQRVKWDEQEVGNGYLEASRDKLTGDVDGLFHAPGKRLRRTADRKGWIMGPRGRYSAVDHVRFYDFGAKVAYDSDGSPTNKLDAPVPGGWKRNEIIPFQLYSSASRDYGLPPDAQLMFDYAGDRLAAEHNLGFFDASGVPPTVIFVQGERTEGPTGQVTFEVPDALIRQIGDLLQNRGTETSRGGRVAIIGLPPGTKTDKHDLAVLSERDMGFVNYRSDNRRRALGAWRLSPIFVADIEDAGKYTAEVERAITKEQVFDPEQRRWSDVLSHRLLGDLGYPHLELFFTELAIKGDEAVRDSADSGADRGLVTRGEWRRAHGYAELPEAGETEEPEPGQVPFGWNGQLVDRRSGEPANGGIEEPEMDELSKALREDVAREFDDAVEVAIGRVRDLAGDSWAAETVIVRKEGDAILVEPYRQNGSG